MTETTSHAEPTDDRAEVIGRRVAAALLDIAVLVVVLVVFALAFGESTSGAGSFQVRLGPVGTLVWGGVALVYYFAFEVAGGRTPGKRALGLRVTRSDGSAPGVGPIAGRTVLRIIDACPCSTSWASSSCWPPGGASASGTWLPAPR